MYTSDKIIWFFVYALTRFLKLVIVTSFFAMLVAIFAIILGMMMLGTGTIFLYPAFLSMCIAFAIFLYIGYYLSHDIIEIIVLRFDPLHPKSVAVDIFERIPGFNVFYLLFSASTDPFSDMRKYSY